MSHDSRLLRPLTLLFILLGSCTQPDQGPVHDPDPIVDEDPWSVLGRAVRTHNAAPTTATAQAVLDAIPAGPHPPTMARHLDAIRSTLAADPTAHIDPRPVSWVIAQALSTQRDTFLVLYGELTRMEIDREVGFVATLEAILATRGYRTTTDPYTTPDSFDAHMAPRNTAGILWRSEGWFDHKPGTPPSQVTTRVWTTDHDARPHRIYSDDWASVLPEGLAFAAIASCGTGGPFAPDEVNVLDHLGAPSSLTFHTFHTALVPRTLFVRTYRSTLATSGYSFDDLTWRAATTLPPDRCHIDPDLCARGQTALVDLIRDGRATHHAHDTMKRDPLTYFPLLIDALEETPSSPPLATALNTLSADFAPTPRSFSTASDWRTWYDTDPEIQPLKQDALYIAHNAPPEAELYVHLLSAFSDHTSYYLGRPRTGIHHQEYCAEQWFRCLYSTLSPWTPDLTRTAPATDTCPLPSPFTVTYDPATQTFTDHLPALIDSIDDFTARCSTM